MLDWCAELAIPAVTPWVFSTDNLQRPPEEVTDIFGAIETKSQTLTPANGRAAVGRQPDDAAPTFSIAISGSAKTARPR
jgi:undecaprenyl pyrophosphate synthase